MLHAIPQSRSVFELGDLTVLVGADSADRLFEVRVSHAEGIDFIVHAMAARPRFLR